MSEKIVRNAKAGSIARSTMHTACSAYSCAVSAVSSPSGGPVNALNRRGRDWSDIPLSRRVDCDTLAALNAFRAKRGRAGETVLLRALDALQGARYIELAEGRAANESFVYGWLAHRLGNVEGQI